jgi:hypothetical protein
VTAGACTGDTNGGKLTINVAGEIVCASDIGGAGGGTGGVSSVFGRTGAVVATAGDYTAAMVSNAADLTQANIFPHPAGQTMPRLLLTGTTSGSLTLATAAVSGTATLIFPGASTDFSTTGGANQVVRQSTAGGALSVSQLDFSSLSGTGPVCTTTTVCPGYQAALTAGTGVSLTGATLAVASTEPGFLTSGTADLASGGGQAGAMQVLATGQLQYIDSAATPARHTGLLVNPVGVAGVLQASTGTGDLSGFVGSTCEPGLVATGIGANGALICAAAPGSGVSTAQVLLATASAHAPQGVNLGALPTGLVLSSVSGGLATITTRPAPVGTILGTSDIQEVTQTRVTPRQCSLATTTTPLVLDLDLCDVAVLSELQQNTQIANPQGAVRPSQSIRFRAHSTTSRLITWGSFWRANPGQALPSHTTGGDTEDVWLFEYSARLGQAVLTYNSQQTPSVVLPADTTLIGTSHALVTGSGPFTPGHCLTMDANLNLVDTGATCGGGAGGATPAGITGDLQMNRAGLLGADSGQVMLDPTSHTLVAANLQGSLGGSYYELRDRLGRHGYLMGPSDMGTNGAWFLKEFGEICVKGGTCFSGLGGGGNVSNSGTPVAGQAAEWVTATTIQGVGTIGTGAYVKATNATLTTPTIAALANLTTNGVVKTSGGTGTLAVDTTTYLADTGVQTVTSGTTYNCPRNGTLNHCKMTFTGAASTVTLGASGTLQDGDRFLLRLRCTVAAQTLAYAANVVPSAAVAGPTSCPLDSTTELIVGFLYSSDTAKLQLIASTN